MRGAFLYKDAVTFKPSSKLWIAGNHKPRIHGTDNGIWRRVRLIPFAQTFSPEERDPELSAKLQAEASGILNWLIAGCLLWQKEGLKPPPEIEAAVEDYRSEEDMLADFVDGCVSSMNRVQHSFTGSFLQSIKIGQRKPGCAIGCRGRDWPRLSESVDGTGMTRSGQLKWHGVRLRETR